MNTLLGKNAALLFICSLAAPLPLMAEAKNEDAPKLNLEPLSLTISKLNRDEFGRGVDPFSMMGPNKVSGISLLVKLAPQPDFNARLLNKGAKLTSFRDDKGEDLLKLPKGRGLDKFWDANKNISVLHSQRGDLHGFQLRAPKTPSAKATKLIAEGSLSFATLQDEETIKEGPVVLEPGKNVETKAAHLKFAPAKGFGAKEGTWWVQLRPDADAFDVSLEIFGADEDEPILDTTKGNRMTQVMNGIISHGFPCPNGKISRIVIRYSPKGEVIKVPFKIETGLGGFEGGGLNPAPGRGFQPRPKPQLKRRPAPPTA
jgi:hypothetical protein